MTKLGLWRTLACFTLLPALGWCAPAYVKSAANGWFPTTGGGGSVAITPTAAGNTFIVSAFSSTTATTLNIADTAGNVWTPVVARTTTTNGAQMQAWMATTAGTSATTIRVSFANGTNYSLELLAEEVSGIAAVDKNTAKGLAATTNPVTIGPLSPAQNGEFLWTIGNGGAITGVGAGFTSGTNFDISHSGYQVLSSSVGAGSSYTAAFSTNSSGANAMLMFATFTASGSSAPPPPPPAGDTTLSPLSPNPAGTYGSSTTVPVIMVDAYGRTTNVSTSPIASVGGSTGSTGPSEDIVSSAACNGTTDDTAALQNDINLAQSTNGSLFIPPGKCVISSTLHISKPITIHGNMGTVCSDTSACGSRIHYTGTGTAISINDPGSTVHRVYLRDFTVSSAGGKSSAAIGIDFNNVEESGLERVNIGDYGGSGAEKLGFNAAIHTSHWAIGWILNCNFEDDTYALDVNGGFYAALLIQNNNLYRVTALIRADGGSANLNILNNWMESVVYMIYADSSNTRLQGGTIIGNHVNTDSGSSNCSGLPCSSARMIKVTTGGGFLTSFMISGNSINLSGGATSFIDSAASIDNFSLISNQLFGSPKSVFGGAAAASVGTLANNMPALGNATRLTQ